MKNQENKSNLTSILWLPIKPRKFSVHKFKQSFPSMLILYAGFLKWGENNTKMNRLNRSV